MAEYQHILYATDLSDYALPVGERVIDVMRRNKAKLTLLHVVQEKDVGAGLEATVPIPGETDSRLVQEMRRRLSDLATQLGVADAEQVVVTSNSRGKQIRHVAEERGVDLIIVGSHGRHGLSLLWHDSTPNTVMHGATCDVLAVYIPR
jgi:universal stress protein A